MADEADGLDMIDPAPALVRFRGEQLELRPLRIGQLPAFSRLVRPIVAEFTPGRNPDWVDSDDLMVLELTELHGEAIIEAAAIATGRPVDWIADVDSTTELVDLVRQIVEVNRDFFFRAIQAQLRAQEDPVEGQAEAQMTTAGPMRSST